jgi:hypothetical protein
VDEEKLFKPSKSTLLHNLISQVIYSDYEHSISKFPQAMIDAYNGLIDESELKKHKSSVKFDQVDNSWNFDLELLEKAIDEITPTVFTILYADRNLLLAFQKIVQRYVSTLKVTDFPKNLSSDGVIKRSYIPEWLKKAIFYRDKGRCQLCGKDLTGLISPTYPCSIHIDHMIPLSQGGSNDPINFQLTCKQCNTSKGAQLLVKPMKLTPFWQQKK